MVNLSKQQMNNLMIFLKRVDIKGDEAFAYVDIMGVLVEAIREGENNVTQGPDRTTRMDK